MKLCEGKHSMQHKSYSYIFVIWVRMTIIVKRGKILQWETFQAIWRTGPGIDQLARVRTIGKIRWNPAKQNISVEDKCDTKCNDDGEKCIFLSYLLLPNVK